MTGVLPGRSYFWRNRMPILVKPHLAWPFERAPAGASIAYWNIAAFFGLAMERFEVVLQGQAVVPSEI